MPVKINLLQVTSTVRDGDEQAPAPAHQDLDGRLAELERRILAECMNMIMEALEKQEER